MPISENDGRIDVVMGAGDVGVTVTRREPGGPVRVLTFSRLDPGRYQAGDFVDCPRERVVDAGDVVVLEFRNIEALRVVADAIMVLFANLQNDLRRESLGIDAAAE